MYVLLHLYIPIVQNRGQQTNSQQPNLSNSLIVNNILLEQSHTLLFTRCPWSNGTVDHLWQELYTRKVKNIYYVDLLGQVCQLCYRIMAVT